MQTWSIGKANPLPQVPTYVVGGVLKCPNCNNRLALREVWGAHSRLLSISTVCIKSARCASLPNYLHAYLSTVDAYDQSLLACHRTKTHQTNNTTTTCRELASQGR
eukprot:6328089-Amphidinium_carterae.1